MGNNVQWHCVVLFCIYDRGIHLFKLSGTLNLQCKAGVVRHGKPSPTTGSLTK